MLNKTKKNNSAIFAKERLHAILSSDRLHCSNQQIKEMECDLLHTVNKYFPVSPSKIKTRILQKEGEEGEFLLLFEASIKST